MPRLMLLVLFLLPLAAAAGEACCRLPLDADQLMLRKVTEGPAHHFFGYYAINPWSPDARELLCMESSFSDRLPEPSDVAKICVLDLESGALRPVAETTTWNFQQGCLAQWLRNGSGREIIFNSLASGEPRAHVLNLDTQERRVLSRALAGVSYDGKLAASISYARLRDTRPGYGYAGAPDPYENEMHPKDDGLYILDVASGESRLIFSLDQAYQLEPVPEQYRDQKMWFNHVIFSRDNQRLFFLGRFRGESGLVSAAFTVNVDGSDPRCVLPYSWGASHFDWLPGRRLLVTTRYQGENPWRHVLFTDGQKDFRVLAPEVLISDGHGHASPEGCCMITDTYPRGKERMQHLYLMNLKTDEIAEVAKLHSPETFTGDWRCDLHPRWNADGTKICIDSTESGTRQLYVLEAKS